MNGGQSAAQSSSSSTTCYLEASVCWKGEMAGTVARCLLLPRRPSTRADPSDEALHAPEGLHTLVSLAGVQGHQTSSLPLCTMKPQDSFRVEELLMLHSLHLQQASPVLLYSSEGDPFISVRVCQKLWC